MSTVDTEHVLVVPTELFHEVGYFQGFTEQVDQYLERLLDPACISYRPRHEMEEDPSFKQLIPYVLFRYTDEAGAIQLFQYTRGEGQGEKRLHSKRSVGIGGHISSIDAAVDSGSDPYQEGMRRELEEEVIIDTPYTVRCVGMINDDLTEVGKVHLGVVHLFDVERPDVQSREDEIREAGFRPVAELMGQLDQFESWSEICLRALFATDPQ
ncbi:MAG: NUDIX domain-containing protein [Pirellulaceae bacterium]|jgi:predicted NUDIX family phosphoesterase|nr:phosphoesterase [Planctomycetaceae bacterium]HIN96055.1 phosphoesterase [Planctomycetota bacterium]